MRIQHENLAEIQRYIDNHRDCTLEGSLPQYERYLRFIGKARKVDASTRILEVGTGMGWFPILCKANGLQCKGLEISPQLIKVAMELGERAGIVPDIQLGNVEDLDMGAGQYDVIVASSVFEHVEKWYSGLKSVYQALSPGGVLFFESTNKFCIWSGEYGALPFYSWLPDSLRYRFRIMVHGPEIMKLGIDFNQFRYPQLKRVMREIGFKTLLDPVDLLEPEKMTGLKRNVLEAARQNRAVRLLVLTFMEATTLVCTK
jgi:2-polyprenyl-3-methyl-5-hydroxy-6-metoxy-1,4-benzoquinol methylase